MVLSPNVRRDDQWLHRIAGPDTAAEGPAKEEEVPKLWVADARALLDRIDPSLPPKLAQ